MNFGEDRPPLFGHSRSIGSETDYPNPLVIWCVNIERVLFDTRSVEKEWETGSVWHLLV